MHADGCERLADQHSPFFFLEPFSPLAAKSGNAIVFPIHWEIASKERLGQSMQLPEASSPIAPPDA